LQILCLHTISVASATSGTGVARCGNRKPQPQQKEDDISSDFYLYFPESLMRAALRFRYVDFMIKSTPAISVAFIVYVTFRGVLW
jgi:hypothetical protein